MRKGVSLLLLFGMVQNVTSQSSLSVKICVLDKGELKKVDLIYETQDAKTTAVTFVNGKKRLFDEAYPKITNEYATNADWFIKNDPIIFDDSVTFVKSGKEKVIEFDLVGEVGAYKGIKIYGEYFPETDAHMIYIPVRRGCIFQGYVEGFLPCGPLIVNPELTEVIKGKKIEFTATLQNEVDNKAKIDYKWSVYSLYVPDKGIIKGNDNGPSFSLTPTASSDLGKDYPIQVSVAASIGKRCKSVKYFTIKVIDK